MRLGAAAVMPLLAACGPSLDTMATEAMDLCVGARNAAFAAGQAMQAVAIPLPPRAQELGRRMNYVRAFKVYRGIAEEARDQVTLTCALEMASFYRDGEAQRFIARYAKHPDAAVATTAVRLTSDPATTSLPAGPLPAVAPSAPASDSAAVSRGQSR